MHIKQKMILGSLLLVAIPLIVSSVKITLDASSESRKAISEQVENNLVAVRDLQKSRIEDYFNFIQDQLITLSRKSSVISAMSDFSESYQEFAFYFKETSYDDAKNSLENYYRGPFNENYKQSNHGTPANVQPIIELLDHNAILLQYQYISGNNYPLGEKNSLTNANDHTDYSQHHTAYHPEFNDFLSTFNYYDVFLVDMQGNVVYSVYKEVDFASNLLNGPFANSGLANVYKAVRNASNTEQVALEDFSPYQPSYNAPAAFIATPIFDGPQQSGVLIFQMPIERINNIMTLGEKWAERGMGESGEVYLVGNDSKARSISRFLVEDKESFITALQQANVRQSTIDNINDKNTNIGIQEINTETIKRALSGNSGVDIIKDYRDINVLSAYAPVNVMGKKWAILSEIDEAEAFDNVNELQTTLITNAIITLIILLILGGLAGILFAGAITRPIQLLTTTIDKIEKNSDLTARIKIHNKDELGAVGESMNRMLEKFQSSIAHVNATTDHLASSSEGLTSITQETMGAINRQRNETEMVATAMNEMNSTVREVSANALHAANSASEAQQQTLDGKRIVSDAVDSIQALSDEISQASKVINNLEKDSEQIGSVLDVIRGIAEQTNLLALNAAIEAARAGEQGRGFAVVADEVRTLASRTQQSTQEIQQMIERLQAGSHGAVSAMDKGANQAKISVERASQAGESLVAITHAVAQITDMNALIATAAEEQSAVAEEINANINNISHVADETATGANQVNNETQQLEQLASELKKMITQFKI